MASKLEESGRNRHVDHRKSLAYRLLPAKGRLKRSVKAHTEASEGGMHKLKLGKPTVAWKFNYVVNIKVMKFTAFRLQAA